MAHPREIPKYIANDIAEFFEDPKNCHLLKYFCEPLDVRLRRCNAIEEAIVIARADRYILFFDEIEEDYSIAIAESHDTIDEWDLIGSLHFAMRALDTRASGTVGT